MPITLPAGESYDAEGTSAGRAGVDLDLARQALDLRGVDQARPEVERRLRAAGHAVQQALLLASPL